MSRSTILRTESALVVNTASRCGFTPQYESLEALYEQYKSRGFVVLAFPANDFLWQEPGSNAEIKRFCSERFHTSFPLFAKISGRIKFMDKGSMGKFVMIEPFEVGKA